MFHVIDPLIYICIYIHSSILPSWAYSHIYIHIWIPKPSLQGLCVVRMLNLYTYVFIYSNFVSLSATFAARAPCGTHQDARISHPNAYFKHPDTHRIPTECGIRMPIHSIRIPKHLIWMPLCSIQIPTTYLLNTISECLIIVSECPMPHPDASMQHPDTSSQKAFFPANSYKISILFIYKYISVYA